MVHEVRDIVARARRVQSTGKKIHWFNIGDPSKFGFRPPPHVTAAVREALNEPKYSGYCPSEGDPQLREAIGKREGVDASNAVITSGLSEGIDFLFQALLDPGDNVLLSSPTYGLYTTKAKILGAQPNFFGCDGDFNPIPEDVRKKINSRTRAMVIINPNNPTGANYPRSVLQELVNIAGEHKLPIIADEIYDMLALDEPPAVNLRSLTGELPLISGNGISKNFLYPGARVGYLAVHGQGADELSSMLVKFCNQRLSVNWEMQRGALAAFTLPATHIEETVRQLRARRDVIFKGLNSIEGISCVKPRGAFYAFPKVETGKFATDKEFVYALLEETGVLVVPGSAFSPVLGGKHFRLVFLAPPEELQETMGKIGDFMKTHG